MELINITFALSRIPITLQKKANYSHIVDFPDSVIPFKRIYAAEWYLFVVDFILIET